MKTTLVTAPVKRAVLQAEVKEHLRVTDNVDATNIDRITSAAIAFVEEYTARKLITQTWKMFLDEWPAGPIKVAFGNLISVTHIKYTDTDEAQTTFSSDNYLVDTDSIPGRIILKYGQSWPSTTLSPKNPIEIQFVTGYGADSTTIPEDIRQGIMLMISHYNEVREPTLQSTVIAKVPLSVESQLWQHRVWDWIL